MGEADIRTEPETLGHSGTKALEQRVGAGDQPQYQCDRVGLFEVDRDRFTIAEHEIILEWPGDPKTGGILAVDAKHGRSEVR
jgi:hypothetical protein